MYQDEPGTTDAASLLSLPPELLVREVFSYLPLKALIQCLRTCRQINELITSSIQLSYQMELEIAGMKDNPHCPYTTYPVIERLRMLRERERRWSHLDCEWRQVARVPASSSGYYDVAPGFYMRGKRGGDISGTTGVYCGKLPSNKDSAIVWVEANLGKTVIDFTASTEKDLLACVSCVRAASSSFPASIQVDFISISTGLAHPLASFPTLDVCTEPEPVFHDALQPCLEICGENFALTYGADPAPRGKLFIWNWMTGEKKVETPLNHCGWQGVAFIREDLLMHPNALWNCLDIFRIKPSKERSNTAESGIRPILSLSLPELAHGQTLVKLQCINHPAPFSSDNPSPYATATSRPFFDDPQAAVLLIRFHVLNPLRDDFYTFAILTHRKTLLDLALGAWETVRNMPPPVSPVDDAIRSGSTTSNRSTVEESTTEESIDRSPSPEPDVEEGSPPPFSDSADAEGGSTRVFPSSFVWENWGPPVTRIFALSPTIHCPPYSAAGARWARTMDMIEPEALTSAGMPAAEADQCIIELVDFGKLRVRRLTDLWFSPTGMVRTLLNEATEATVRMELAPPTMLPSSHGVFKKDVYSSLPCIQITLPQNYFSDVGMQYLDGVLMDEERIIGLYRNIETHMTEELGILYFG